MESTMGDSPGSNEDLTVKKKSKFKILKTRLFGRMKWRGTGGSIKQSQSASDITAPEGVKAGYDLEEEFIYSQGTLSSRALSHDSIFFSSQPQASDEPERVASQENVHGRVKALQTRLLQQNMRFGPLPVTVLTQRMDDAGASSEDDGLPRSPPDISLHEGLKYPDPHRHPSSLSLAGTGSEEEEQGPAPSSSHPVSPVIRSPSQSTRPPVLPPTRISSLAADFDTPARFVPCLDNSAARHRMSVKPRNQRASAKGRRATSSVHRLRSESLNDLECPAPEKEDEESLRREDFHKEIVHCHSYSTQALRSRDGSAGVEVKNLPTVVVPSAEEEIRGGSDTELLKNDGVLLEQLPSIARPLEPMGCITTNPVFLQPVPVALESFQEGEPNPGTVTVSPVSALTEVQKPQSVVQEAVVNKPLSPTQPRGTKDLIKEIMQNSSHKYPPSYTIPSKSCVLEHTCSKQDQVSSGESILPNTRDVLGNDFWGMTQTVQVDPPLNHQSVAAPSAQKFLQSGDRIKTSPLKKNTAVFAEATMQESASTGFIQQTVVPLSGPDDQQNTEAVKHRQQRPNSGSSKFSVSSAWDRPRASSFTCCAEQTGPKNEDKLPSSHKIQERLLAKQEPPSNPLSGLKGKGSPIVNIPPNPKLHLQSAGSLETVRVKDLSWIPEKRSTLRKGDTASRRVKEETDAVKPVQFLGHADGGAGGEKNIQENELRSKPETAEEDPEMRNSFGVKLRSTSLSLKYRSDVAQAEMMSKRRSAEVCPPASPHGPQTSPLSPAPVRPRGSQPPTDEDMESSLFMDNLTAKLPLPKKTPSKNSGSLGSSVIHSLTSSTPACREREKNEFINSGDRGLTPKSPVAPPKEVEPASSEPAWMTMAREKTRSLQQLFTSKLVPMASPQASPQPVPRNREECRPMSWLLQDKPVKTDIMEGNMDTTAEMKVKSLLMPRKEEGVPPDIKTNPTKQTEPGKTSSLPVISHKPLDDVKCEVKMDGRSPMNIRSPASTRTALASQTLNEDRWQKKSESLSSLLSSSTSMSPTTAAEQPMSRHAQPSWLELAKRKSLAWSDKAMD
ncbi:uncharacterized protein KIAA1211-like isoform X2 [Scleropages formosus]|nr:uncharacterized protein KIAA1211-like homolog isoform X2 [Scleropages formosus]XP_018605398.1 uncharacterized protein KIAA1211-like homolog isoform X2 [Scleropages formosus]XP_018605399.1 uncharacterized protein KIAA1211-like homolog isoform X2 [Scleropages formosus]